MKKLYLLALLMLTGCVYPFSVDLDEVDEPSLVIDANILLGSDSQVKLSYLQSLDVGQHSQAYPRLSAKVWLEAESGQKIPAEPGVSGRIFTVPSFPYSLTDRYRIRVEWEGNTYLSEWVTPVEPPQITDFTLSADAQQVYAKMSMEDNGNGSGYAAAIFEEIWYFHADHMKVLSYDPDANSVSVMMNPDDAHFWCWYHRRSEAQVLINYTELNGKVNDYVVHRFYRSSNRNHKEYHIRVKLWNLTPEQYKYRKQLEENASIGSNLFSPEPGELRGNVYCETEPTRKVYGYVNISRVVYKEAELDDRYNRWTTPSNLTEYSEDMWYDAWQSGFVPIDYMYNAEGEQVPGWGTARCYDCIAAGGTLEKPEFD